MIAKKAAVIPAPSGKAGWSTWSCRWPSAASTATPAHVAGNATAPTSSLIVASSFS